MTGEAERLDPVLEVGRDAQTYRVTQCCELDAEREERLDIAAGADR
jgi:hypothetical protein